MTIISRNTNTLAPVVYRELREKGVPSASRNGPVLRFPGPVTITLTHPWERVHFSEARNANPFFHLIEAAAMLAGHNSVKLMAHFAKNMLLYTDDGQTYNAFYGARLRTTWGDQLAQIVWLLSQDPDCRQAVAQLWDPQDLWKTTRDKACNTQLVFSVSPEKELVLTSFNRSNDAIYGGVSGANIVHLSFFQEYVACALGLEIGPWHHVSTNLHAYEKNPLFPSLITSPPAEDGYPDYYQQHGLTGVQLFTTPKQRHVFDHGIRKICFDMEAQVNSLEELPKGDRDYLDVPFLRHGVLPAFNSWQAHKRKNPDLAMSWAQRIIFPDWYLACQEWLQRKYSSQ